MTVAAIGWNLFVGHYREALAADYPPEPDAVQSAPDAATTEAGVEACWRGDDEADADREALCLFIRSPFALGGFQSYMLWLIGLFAWLLGTHEWYRNDDPYPGYGKRARKRRKTERKLADERAELLQTLKEEQDKAQRRLLGAFTDPVDSRKLGLGCLRRPQAATPRFSRLCQKSGGKCTGCTGHLSHQQRRDPINARADGLAGSLDGRLDRS